MGEFYYLGLIVWEANGVKHRGLELLKSATKFGKNVKAIVVTGSINAITTGEDVGKRVYDSAAWLPVIHNPW